MSQNTPWDDGFKSPFENNLNAPFFSIQNSNYVYCSHTSSLFPLFCSRRSSSLSDLDAFDSLVDGFQQGLVLWVLVAVLVGVHVSQCVDIAVEVLLGDGLTLWCRIHKDSYANGELCSYVKMLWVSVGLTVIYIHRYVCMCVCVCVCV